ncbi:hypothetical protein D1007_18817 [Hordeum vulgare]|nr:hypothetical protein D1007_18817 [Hordeum vulgare]
MDWRSSRPGGSDWRGDAGSPGRWAPDRRAVDPPAAQALAKKKKKPKKKKVPTATPGGSRCPNPAEASAAEPDPVPPLEKVWVLVYGLPRGGSVVPWGGKLTHILKAISEPVGKLITADQASFEDDGPARIEILCPAPAEIDGLSLVFYFGSKGRRLTFELESPTPVDPLGLSPAGPEPGDGGLDDEGALRRRVRLLRELMLHEGLRPIHLMVGGTQPLRPLDHRAPQGVPQSWRWCRCRR